MNFSQNLPDRLLYVSSGTHGGQTIVIERHINSLLLNSVSQSFPMRLDFLYQKAILRKENYRSHYCQSYPFIRIYSIGYATLPGIAILFSDLFPHFCNSPLHFRGLNPENYIFQDSLPVASCQVWPVGGTGGKMEVKSKGTFFPSSTPAPPNSCLRST